ncbi:MAG: extracellular solute-binding protein [Candidatus Taylorbacteria bacterium]|nr:extracellular solute-binding protein [Candidatus Taylorbacteria bacterium]
MNLTNLIGSNKIFYALAGLIIIIIIVLVIITLINLGGEDGQEKATLEFWGVFDSKQDFAQVIAAFKQLESGITVNYKQFSFEDYERELINALAAGTGPDIFMIHHTWLAKHRDKLSPMPTVSRKEEYKFITPVEFQNQFVDIAHEDLVFENKIYALPLYVDTLGIFYNKDMLNTAGIVRPPKDWEEFNDDVKLLTKFDEKNNITQSGAAVGTARNINRSTDILAVLMLQNGTKMTDPENTVAAFTRTVSEQRTGENALQYYTDFANPAKAVYAWNDDQHYSIDAFVEGKVAMMINYSHQTPTVSARYKRLNYGIAPLPQFSQVDAKNYANYLAVAVSDQSKSQDVAWRFLSFITSKDGALEYLTKTSRPSARRDLIELQRNDPMLGVFAIQALSARSWYQADNNAIDQIFADMIDDVNVKGIKVRDALKSAEAKVTTLMSR